MIDLSVSNPQVWKDICTEHNIVKRITRLSWKNTYIVVTLADILKHVEIGPLFTTDRYAYLFTPAVVFSSEEDRDLYTPQLKMFINYVASKEVSLAINIVIPMFFKEMFLSKSITDGNDYISNRCLLVPLFIMYRPKLSWILKMFVSKVIGNEHVEIKESQRYSWKILHCLIKNLQIVIDMPLPSETDEVTNKSTIEYVLYLVTFLAL